MDVKKSERHYVIHSLLSQFSTSEIEQIARMANCSTSTVNKILRGQYSRSTPNVINVTRIAERLIECRR